MGGITSHLGHKVIFHSFSDFDLGMAPCDLELLLGEGALQTAGRPFSFELNTLGEQVGYCQSLPSDFVLRGASVYGECNPFKIFKMA